MDLGLNKISRKENKMKKVKKPKVTIDEYIASIIKDLREWMLIM